MSEDHESGAARPQAIQTTPIRVTVGESWAGLEAQVQAAKLRVIQLAASAFGLFVAVFIAYAMVTSDEKLLTQCWDLVRETVVLCLGWAFGKGATHDTG